MAWLSKEGRELDNETILHLHSEIRNERRFWFNKSVEYVNFYSTVVSALLSAFILGLTQISNLGQFKYVLLFIPIIPIILCIYAKKSIRICYRQFLENTAVMAKLEVIIGIYSPIKLGEVKKIIFPGDKFINPIRHYENFMRFNKLEEFVEDDLIQSNRSFKIKTRVFSILELLSIIMLIGTLILMILEKL